MATGGSSYWSIRRRIRRDLKEHFSEIESLTSNPITENTSNSLQIQTSNTSTSLYDVENNDQVVNSNSQCLNLGEVSVIDDDKETDYRSDFEQYFENACNSSDEESEFEQSDQESLDDDLRNWAVKHQVPNICISDLLSILKKHHPHLPKDPRTLLKTKVKYAISNKCGGQYYHFGIFSAICQQLRAHSLVDTLPDQFCLSIQINIDGLPLFKSASDQFWPILGMFSNLELKKPFVIGLFYGLTKPNILDHFLEDFVNEYLEIKRNGLHCSGKNFKIVIDSVICDSPARAFVKCVKSFSGYHGCDKCTQNGTWIGKMTYPETNAPLRTDETFQNRQDEDHHKGPSPLSQIQIGMVSQIPLDYMHLVCLGVVKRLLLLWMKGPLHSRLGVRIINNISSRLTALKNSTPSEFARKPRSLHEIERWKATEFRQFLLYTGMIVLHGLIHQNMYQNFLLLCVGMHILLNEKLCEHYHEYAHDLLVAFVKHFCQIYGNDMAVYNVHGLVHLANDAKKFKSLENISAFPFENYLSNLKQMVRKPEFPLAQIVRRLSEKADVKVDKKYYPKLSKNHANGPLPDVLVDGHQYQKVQTDRYILKTDFKDSSVRIQGEFCVLKNIVLSQEGQTFVVYQSFQAVENVFIVPLESKLLGIVKVSNLNDNLKIAKLSDIEAKCVILPFKDANVIIPFTDAVWTEPYMCAVVEFPEEDGVEAVPLRWLTDGEKQCFWPQFKNIVKITMAIKTAVKPTKDFQKFPVRVLKKYYDYDAARKHLDKATYVSDLQTEAEDDASGALMSQKRAKRPNPKFQQSDDSSETEEETAMPAIQKRQSPRKKIRTAADVPNLPQLPTLPTMKQTPQTKRSQSSTLFDSCIPAQPTKAIEERTLVCVTEIKAQVHFNTKMLQSILKKLDGISHSNEDTEEETQIPDVSFPIDTKDTLLKMDDILQSEESRKKVARSLSTIGGENVKSSARRLLAHMISNKVAQEINWMGKGQKVAFSKLNLNILLKAAVRKNKLCSSATDSEIEAIAKDWFRFAKDREGGRKQREERKKEKDQEQANQPLEV